MKDINNLDTLFIENLHQQLLFEKIAIDYDVISSKIGQIAFNSTNNNRKSIGVLNYNIEKLNYFKYEYSIFNSSVIREMTHKLNKTPFKQLDWKNPSEKMISLLRDNI
ncbi:hypothetical protein G1J88_04585 [Tenacibaculum dicentrarchi]|nr:hypothetical protein [Tenacibaculum dicentrarchi]